MFIAPRLVPASTPCGEYAREESRRLSRNARAILAVLRKKWERDEFDRPCGRTQALRTVPHPRKAPRRVAAAAMLVIPSDVVYSPKFTYIWTLAVGRFPDAMTLRLGNELRPSAKSPGPFSMEPA